MTTAFDSIASEAAINTTEKALSDHGFMPEIVETGADALARIKELIPAGASVMNGSSKTLTEIGFIDYFKSSEHNWNNLHGNILAETDPVKQAQLRSYSVVSDYYLGSVHALTQTGQLLIASGSGSQLPHLVEVQANQLVLLRLIEQHLVVEPVQGIHLGNAPQIVHVELAGVDAD